MQIVINAAHDIQSRAGKRGQKGFIRIPHVFETVPFVDLGLTKIHVSSSNGFWFGTAGDRAYKCTIDNFGREEQKDIQIFHSIFEEIRYGCDCCRENKAEAVRLVSYIRQQEITVHAGVLLNF